MTNNLIKDLDTAIEALKVFREKYGNVPVGHLNYDDRYYKTKVELLPVKVVIINHPLQSDSLLITFD